PNPLPYPTLFRSIADRPARIIYPIPGLVRGAAFSADRKVVLHSAHAFGIAGQALCQLAGGLTAGASLQGDNAVAGADLDIETLGIAVPQQFGLHRCGSSCIVEAIRESAVAVSGALGAFTADSQLVVHFVHALDAEGDLFGQIPFDIRLDLAGERGDTVFYINVNGEGTEMPVEGEGGPYRAFLAGFGQLAAHVAVGGINGHRPQREGADGCGG